MYMYVLVVHRNPQLFDKINVIYNNNQALKCNNPRDINVQIVN